jgi:carbonic anhydrase
MTTEPASPQTDAAELDRALAENARHAAQFDRSALPLPPDRRLAVLACMDARLTVEHVLGLRTEDAHIIRNADGLASADAIRSLVIRQHLLGTEEVTVIEHPGCGMLTFKDEPVRESIAQATGVEVDLPLHAFSDLEANLRSQVERIRAQPWVKPVPISGLIYEVETGLLRPVATRQPS